MSDNQQDGGAWRPPTGFMAWQAIIGYIARSHDTAGFRLHVAPLADGSLQWDISCMWADKTESVRQPTLPDAMNALWEVLSERQREVLPADDDPRLPVRYADHEWLDDATEEILHRVIWTVTTVFDNHWHMTIHYHPEDDARSRITMTLNIESHTIKVTTRAATLQDAARQVYRLAAPHCISHAQSRHDSSS